MNSAVEILKPVDGYEDRYLVSSFGYVRSLRSNRSLSPGHLKDGTPYVLLHKNRTRKLYIVKHLVADTFLPSDELTGVKHLDGDITNNAVSNLQRVESRYKMHSTAGIAVRCVTTGQEFPSMCQAANACNVDQSNMSKRLRNNNGKAILNGLEFELLQSKEDV